MGRWLLASLVSMLFVMAGAAALASPFANPHAETFPATCNGTDLTVLIARGNPAHVVGSTSRIIPHHFTFELRIDGETAFVEEGSVGRGQKRGLQDRMVTCTFQFEFTPEEVAMIEQELGVDLTGALVTGHGTVRALMTPAR
jgi:hypothetical protein